MKSNRVKNNSGQALLIVLLAMATITTVVLSIVSRSVSEVEITNREEDSLRAFTAAEAGIEETIADTAVGTTVNEDIQTPVISGGSEVTLSSYEAEVTGFPENGDEYAYPFEMLSSDSATVWFKTKQGNMILPCDPTSSPCYEKNTIKICWADRGTEINDSTPAIEVTFYYERTSGQESHIATTAYDPNSDRRSSNNFDPPDAPDGVCSISGTDYEYQKLIDYQEIFPPSSPGAPLPGNVTMMKVRFLYNDVPHSFGVSGAGTNLPSQGKKVSSQGVSGNSARRIEAFVLNASSPSIFDSSIYSGSSIVK